MFGLLRLWLGFFNYALTMGCVRRLPICNANLKSRSLQHSSVNLTALIFLVLALPAFPAIIDESMTNNTAPGWILGGAGPAILTSGGDDPSGDGWLRLTNTNQSQAGYAYLDTAFDINDGVVIQFDYATYGGNGADGYSIYLFDGATPTFQLGASGGSLGYAQKTGIPGLSGGYIGVGIDEWGNFSNATEGRVGGVGFRPSSVTIRGPASTGYGYLGGSVANVGELWIDQATRPGQFGADYRRVVIYLTPLSGGSDLQVDVYIQFGYNQPLTSMVTGVTTGQVIPALVKVGYAASTGGSTNIHEIRNLLINPLSTDINLAIYNESLDSNVEVGDIVTYTVTARNLGPVNIPANNVSITDSIPAEIDPLTLTVSCVAAGGGVCVSQAFTGNDLAAVATLPFNSEVIYTISGTLASVPIGSILTSTAEIFPGTATPAIIDYDADDDTDSLDIAVVIPSALASSYKTVLNTSSGSNADTNSGDTLHYTIKLIDNSGGGVANVTITDVIDAGLSYDSNSLTVADSSTGGSPVSVPDPIGLPGTLNLSGYNVPALGTLTFEYDVTVTATVVGTLLSNQAIVTATGISETFDAQDLVITGAPAAGTKSLYLDSLNAGGVLTRAQPAADTNDFIDIDDFGGTASFDLEPAMQKEISLNGPIGVDLWMRRGNIGKEKNGNRNMQVTLSKVSGGSVTEIGVSAIQSVNLTGAIQLYPFPITGAGPISVGDKLRLKIDNLQNKKDRSARVYSVASGANHSKVKVVPTPVINVDSISFWTDTMGAGTQVTNPDPVADLDIFARIIVSDPFGDADIQAPDDLINPTTASLTDAGGNNVTEDPVCASAPCYVYAGEDLANDPPGDATRTFYYRIKIPADPAPRGTWTLQVTANEGLEVGDISHIVAEIFDTSEDSKANLTSSTKTALGLAGDISPGDIISYEVVLINSGGEDADNLVFTDNLQANPPSSIALTFDSASTNCLDESDAALASPTHSSGVVSLSNISVDAAGSCKITINVLVVGGSAGDLIDNSAVITNPNGFGGTPTASTLILNESLIPASGNKQLYLDMTAIDLSRVIPSASSTIEIGDNNGVSRQFQFSATTREMTLAAGPIGVDLWLDSDNSKNGKNRNVTVQLDIEAPVGTTLFTATQTKELPLVAAPTAPSSFGLTNPAAVPLPLNTVFTLTVTNNEGNNNRRMNLVQPVPPGLGGFSEVVMPVIDSIAVTEIKFFDLSAIDDSVTPGCATTFSCGNEINPGVVESGFSIWVRAVIEDAFGSTDVNSGCELVAPVNCPTFALTDPNSVDKTPAIDELAYLQDIAPGSRQFEVQITPGSFMDGLEGVWQTSVTGSEGAEALIFDTSLSSFERFGPPSLTILKTVAGSNLPGGELTYNNLVVNTGAGPAYVVVLTNTLSNFISLKLFGSTGTWTAVFDIDNGFESINEQFDSGNGLFDYDPVTDCGTAANPTNIECDNSAIKQWRVELNQLLAPGVEVNEQYKATIN